MEERLLAPAVADAEGVEEIQIDEEEEAEPLKVLPDPGQPTDEQLELHRLRHWPYRA